MEKLWEKIKKSVSEGVSIAAEKTEEYSKFGKVKIEILNTKRKISKAFTELGGITYDSIKSGKTTEIMKSEPVIKVIDELKKLEEDLEKSEKKLKEMKKEKQK
ncbi:hypothetical protein ACFL50_02365 [Candidatus Latescibacterota bacterium]